MSERKPLKMKATAIKDDCPPASILDIALAIGGRESSRAEIFGQTLTSKKGAEIKIGNETTKPTTK